MREPRDPLLKVVFVRVNARYIQILNQGYVKVSMRASDLSSARTLGSQWGGIEKGHKSGRARPIAGQHQYRTSVPSFANDPSAGSPTETLLRLLLPLNDQV